MPIKYFLKSLICLILLSIPICAQRLIFDTSFTPTINGSVHFVEIQSDQKILIAGDFTTVNGVTRNKIARLNTDGSLDTSFNANATTIITTSIQSAVIRSMEVLPDGKILLAGWFGLASALVDEKVVVRLNADGSFDNTLTSIPQIRIGLGSGDYVQKAAQLPNGKILICGDFTSPNGNQQPKIARYNFDGSYDSTFTTTINGDCRDIEVQPDGKYLVAGVYTTVNGSARVGLARFNPDGSVDTSFNAAPLPYSSPAYYLGIELQSDGKIIGFHLGNSDMRVSRLNADGSLEVAFPSKLGGQSFNAAFQPNGKVIVVGEYRDNFMQSPDFNRFNRDGTHDPSIRIMHFSGPDTADAKAVAVAADGKVIVGGSFNKISYSDGSGLNQPFLARLVPQAIPIKPKYDFDGDGKDDLAVYRPSDRFWYLNRSTAGFFAAQFGLPQDKPIVTDYDKDGKADIAIFRDGIWAWLRSSDSAFDHRSYAKPGDIPQSGDYSGVLDFIVFRPSEAKFHVIYSSTFYPSLQPLEMGVELMPTDKPVVADYDGDGKVDLAVFRDGHWFIRSSNDFKVRHYKWGTAGDKPVVGDFDGDGRTDYAVFRPSDRVWYIQRTTQGFYAIQWGLSDDLPVPADYDGDGKTDIAVYRNGFWYQWRSNNSFHFEHFGLSNDIPAQLR